jgi:GTP-binding protein
MPFQLSVSLDDDMAMDISSMQNDDGQRKLRPVRKLKKNKKNPLIAIVGRPNVGKSALVNRIAGTQNGGAIVADESGITRDRTYRSAEFLGEKFQLVDTGGLVFDDNDALFAREIREQAMIAIDEAAGVILVVDGKVGLSNMDQELADFLRKQITREIPVHVAVNKCESEKTGAVAAAEFWSLGLGEPFPVSALHGVGTAELLETMFESIDKKGSAIKGFGTKAKKLAIAKEKMKINPRKKVKGETEEEELLRKYGIGKTEELVAAEYDKAMAAFDEEEDPEEIGIAIIGRPNVGKSSLLNSLFGSTRAIVSDMAGTTRDSIDAVMERPPPEGSDELSTIYRFIDTAGIRRKGKVDFGPEFFMVNRALRAIRRADVGEFIRL